MRQTKKLLTFTTPSSANLFMPRNIPCVPRESPWRIISSLILDFTSKFDPISGNWTCTMPAMPAKRKWPDFTLKITWTTLNNMLAETFPTSLTVLALISLFFPKIKRLLWIFCRKNKNLKSVNPPTVLLSTDFTTTAKFLQVLQSILRPYSWTGKLILP